MFASGYCGGMGVAGWLVMIAFWGGFIALVLWAVTRLFPTSDRGGEAVELLDRRLATGQSTRRPTDRSATSSPTPAGPN